MEIDHRTEILKADVSRFSPSSKRILINTQTKVSFLITLNYSKMIPRLVESSFKGDKNVGNFLIRSALKTNSNMGSLPIVSHVPPQMSFIV